MYFRHLILFTLMSVITCSSIASSDISDRVELSGFARVIGGYLDEESAKYQGYSDAISLSQQSLFALQGDVKFTDNLSLSTQLLAHSGEKRESGVEWLYLAYEPSQNWQFKLGKLRTPFFRYNDVIDVGFAYPWITPPVQVYSGFLFTNYEGISGTYKTNLSSFSVELEAYYGSYNGDFPVEDVNIGLDVSDIKGVVLSARNGNLSMRTAIIHSSDFYADVPGIDEFADALELAGFAENASSLRFDGSATGYQASINYDTLDYFAAAEWTKIDSELLLVPTIESYYATFGYNFNPFQAHITFASSKNSRPIPENLIPKGVAPQLDQLSYGYDAIIYGIQKYPLDSISIGVRWDFRHNMAAKAEVTFLNGDANESSFFSEFSDPSFDRKATLYQVGLEWFF